MTLLKTQSFDKTLLYVNVSLLYSLPSTQFNGYKNILRKIAAAQLMDIYTSKDICHKCYSYIYILICTYRHILYLKICMHACIAKQNHTIFHSTAIGNSQRWFKMETWTTLFLGEVLEFPSLRVMISRLTEQLSAKSCAQHIQQGQFQFALHYISGKF